MPIYEVKSNHLNKIEETSFGKTGLRERGDLQRLLRNQIEIIAPDVLVIAEEFGDFEGSKRRIDLLGIDKDANIVVIELKRTDDGGHMELQALRYAAMVSTITFDEAVRIYAEHLETTGGDTNAEEKLLDFLGLDEPDEGAFAKDVRVVLASAEFSKEITGSVLWLNTYGLDIRCVRLKPYNDAGRVFIDVEQVIPLPEASEYQIKVAAKNNQERKARVSTRNFTRHDVTVYGITAENLAKRNVMFYVVKSLCTHGTSPEEISEIIHWRSKRMFFEVAGEYTSEEFIKRASGNKGKNGKVFDPTRWFCDDDELIVRDGKTYAFSNQWGMRWKEALNIVKEKFPEAGIEFSASGEV